jgi:hypothetical protein
VPLRRARASLTALAFAGLAVCSPRAQAQCPPPGPPALINEVLFDPSGADAGLEFVELINSAAAVVSLAGLRIEAGDGSGPGRFTLRWEGAAGDTLAPGRRFVVGGAMVSPAPDRVVELGLQNGPDALRLVWPDGATEVLGWGAHEHAEYFCGAPAPDPASGFSLVRRPDGVRRGSNAADFEPATPSPGGPNQVGRDVALVPGTLRIAPERPAPGTSFTLEAALASLGSQALGAREVGVRAAAREPDGRETPLADTHIDHELAPGDTLRISLALAWPDPGKLWLRVDLALADNHRPEGDRDSIPLRVGPGLLEITEIQFRPEPGEPEWVELRAREPLAPDGWRILDAGGGSGRVEAPGARLEAESLAVITQDRAALLARRPALDGARVWQAAPWPALNNTDGPDGFADRVTLREPDGTLGDAVAYSGDSVPAGGSLERGADGEWRPLPGGSPLAPPRPLPPLAGRLLLAPSRWHPARGAPLVVGYALPWPRARAALELYDLRGRRQAHLVSERDVTGRGEWTVGSAGGRGLPSGYYLVVLRARSGTEEMVERTVLRIEAEAP